LYLQRIICASAATAVAMGADIALTRKKKLADSTTAKMLAINPLM
jgi:hypothetical protein